MLPLVERELDAIVVLIDLDLVVLLQVLNHLAGHVFFLDVHRSVLLAPSVVIRIKDLEVLQELILERRGNCSLLLRAALAIHSFIVVHLLMSDFGVVGKLDWDNHNSLSVDEGKGLTLELGILHKVLELEVSAAGNWLFVKEQILVEVTELSDFENERLIS